MAIITCNKCFNHFDDDYFPCEESPVNGELVCPDCLAEQEYDIEQQELEDLAKENRRSILNHCKIHGC